MKHGKKVQHKEVYRQPESTTTRTTEVRSLEALEMLMVDILGGGF